ncbi:hypothetical protein YC2023_047033 [Brassica napus]
MVSRRRFAQVYSSDDEEAKACLQCIEKGIRLRPPINMTILKRRRGRRDRTQGDLTTEHRCAKPVGEPVKVTGRGERRRNHDGQFEYKGERYELKDGGNWVVNDTRELFYSFHRNEVPVESVMHRCLVNFVPDHKQLPRGRGFIVRKVYDTVDKKLWKFTDKDYAVSQQREIDLFVDKSLSRLGDLPDL